jgi:hypothetical protein
VPGLGQLIDGETGLGLAFLGGYTACGIICLVGLTGIWSENYYPPSVETRRTILLGGGGGMLAIQIWSIVDAVKVAKVNSMYVRNLRRKISTSHRNVTLY